VPQREDLALKRGVDGDVENDVAIGTQCRVAITGDIHLLLQQVAVATSCGLAQRLQLVLEAIEGGARGAQRITLGQNFLFEGIDQFAQAADMAQKHQAGDQQHNRHFETDEINPVC
jgi:hypothetical protein